MEDFEISLVIKRSVKGVFALISRTLLIRFIGISTGILLTIFLSPSVFGVFYIVSSILPFLSYFSDIGLAASLIQKKEEITKDDLKTTFTIQQGLVLTLVGLALIIAPSIGSFYNLDREGIRLFQALVIAFFLSSLKTIPSILLERNLQFQKLVIPEIVETLFFNSTLLFLAVKGYGIESFTYAVLARGFSGLITIYIISPWKIKLGFSRNSAKKLLSFGIPFQTNSILALIKDDLLVMYIGRILPLSQVGYIGFAQKIAFTPLRLIMDNVIRITFPSFARLQHDKETLAKGIEKSLFAISFFIFPSFFGLVLLSPYLIEFIPKYSKWEPALLSLSFFATNAVLSSISTPLTNALNAIGKVKITLYLMTFWTIATWIITPIAISFFGFNGVSIASAIISLSVVIVVYIARRYIDFNILDTIKYPFICSVIMGTFIYLVSRFMILDLLSLIFIIIFGSMIYLGSMYLFAREKIILDIKRLRENLAS